MAKKKKSEHVTSLDGDKFRKISGDDSNTYYKRLAYLLSHSPCWNCGSPVVRGNVCYFCGRDPSTGRMRPND